MKWPWKVPWTHTMAGSKTSLCYSGDNKMEKDSKGKVFKGKWMKIKNIHIQESLKQNLKVIEVIGSGTAIGLIGFLLVKFFTIELEELSEELTAEKNWFLYMRQFTKCMLVLLYYYSLPYIIWYYANHGNTYTISACLFYYIIIRWKHDKISRRMEPDLHTNGRFNGPTLTMYQT